MKTQSKIPLCTILFFLSTFTLCAQIGLKGGLVFTDIAFKTKGQSMHLGYDIDLLEHKLPLTSYLLGIYTNMDINKRIQICPELLYTRQGLNYSEKFLYEDVKYKLLIDYIQLPLLLKYKLQSSRTLKPVFILGPYVALKLQEKNKMNHSSLGSQCFEENIHSWDFGAIFSFALQKPVKTNVLSFEFRIAYSLFDMMDPIDGYIPEYDGPAKAYARNISIGILVGHTLNQKSVS